MKFYIYDAYDSEYKPLKVEIEPTLNEVLDETLDSVSLSLLPTSDPNPYKPMSKVAINILDGDPDLPSSYQQVKYIGFSGTQYIDTGVAPGTNINFEISVSDVTDGTYILTQGNYGLRVYNSNFVNFVENKRYRAKDVRITTSKVYNIIGSNTSLIVNKIPAITETDNDTPNGNVVLFSLVGLNSQGKLYGCKIWNDTTLVCDFVPCYRKSDNVIGLYEKVGGSFYTNDGTGTFTKGANVYYELLYFNVVVDTVEIFSHKPITYKHVLNLAQNTRALSKQIVRNTKITQPATKYKESLVAISQGLNKNYGLTRQWYSGLAGNYEPLALDNREKIKNTWVKIDVQAVVSDQNTPSQGTWIKNISNVSSINSAITAGSISWNGTLVLYYNYLGTDYTETITTADLGGTLYFNREMACPKIASILPQGATNIYLGLTTTTAVMDSTTFNVFDTPFTGSNLNIANGKVVAFIMCQIKLKVEIYYYSAYDVLELLRERQAQRTSTKYRAPLFNLPISGETYNLLKNTVSPEITWTQNTLYECVADVFRLFDAIFTMDSNNTLQIEYYNDISKPKITPQLVGKTVSLSEDKYFNGFVSYFQDARLVESFPSERGFAPIRSQTLGILPDRADHFFIVDHPIHSIIDAHIMGFRTLVYNGYGVGEDSIANQRINSVTVEGQPPFEISHYIVEKSVWTNLDTEENIYRLDPKLLKQNNTVFFERLDNKIQLAYTYSDAVNVNFFSLPGLLHCCGARMAGVYQLLTGGLQNVGWAPQYYGPSIPNWNGIGMNLKYIASIDGRLKVESIEHRLDGETIVDQSNGAVDINKLGLNILGLALKLGQPTLTATRKITSISNRIRKGYLFPYQDELWIANSISYKVLKNGIIQENITFVKNFNMLSLRTQVLREKRLSSISRQLTVKSEDIISDYLYISSESKTNSLIQDVHFNKNYVYSAIKSTFKNADLEKPTYSYIPMENYDKYISSYMSAGEIEELGENDYESTLVLQIPTLFSYFTREITVTKFGSDYPATITWGWNSVTIIVDAQDERDFDNILVSIRLYKVYPYIYVPLSKYGSGNALCFEMAFNDSISAGNQTIEKDSNSWIGSTYPYFTQSVIYTDDYGFRDDFTIKIDATSDEFVLGRYFPNIPKPEGATNFLNIADYYAYKQPNEIFALNYEIVLLAVDYNVDFIGSKLVNENFLVTSETPINQKLLLYYTTSSDDDDFQYSVLDTEGHEGHYTSITSVSQSGNTVTFNFSAISNLKTWAICDENGKIYFASNREFSGSKSSLTLYLYPRNSRIDEFIIY